MAFTVNELGGIFEFQWSESDISMRIDHIRTHTDGRISSEVHIRTSASGMRGHIHHQTVSNLLGDRARFVKAVSEQYPLPDGDWKAMVASSFEHVVNRLREGEPVHWLGQSEPSESLEWRLWPILHEGQPTILFGLGGSLKSTLAGLYSIRVASGISAEPGNVLVLDYESNQEAFERRHRAIAKGLGIPLPTNIGHRYCSKPLADEVDELRKQIQDQRIALVVVDSAMYACNGEPEKADPSMAYFRALRALRTTSLTIAHQNNDEQTKRPFGSVVWWNSPRSVIQVKRSGESGDAKTELALFNRKTNESAGFKPIGYDVSFVSHDPMHWHADNLIRFETKRVADMDEVIASGVSLPERIRAALGRGWLSKEQLSDAVGVPYTSKNFQMAVGRMMKDHKISQRLTDNAFGLMAEEAVG